MGAEVGVTYEIRKRKSSKTDGVVGGKRGAHEIITGL